jgi:hypothetical protein
MDECIINLYILSFHLLKKLFPLNYHKIPPMINDDARLYLLESEIKFNVLSYFRIRIKIN